MTMPQEMDPRTAFAPIPVIIKNWTDNPAPKPAIFKTTFKTYILDVAGVVGPKTIQICDYEPTRKRIIIQPIDQSVMIDNQPFGTVVQLVSATVGGQGRYLPVTTAFEYIFYGADALFLDALLSTTRVTVTREYA